MYEQALVNIELRSNNIWNLDETGVSTVQSTARVISRRGSRNIGQVTSAERGSLVTIIVAVNPLVICLFFSNFHNVNLFSVDCLEIVDKASQSLTENNIEAGFRATGIFPVNPLIFENRDFANEQQIEQQGSDESNDSEELLVRNRSTAIEETNELSQTLTTINPIPEMVFEQLSNRGRP